MDAQQLIETWQRNNTYMHLTRMLHSNGDHFLRVIKGDRIEVPAPNHPIAHGPRHRNIILLECPDVRERMLPSWSIGAHQGTGEPAGAI